MIDEMRKCDDRNSLPFFSFLCLVHTDAVRRGSGGLALDMGMGDPQIDYGILLARPQQSTSTPIRTCILYLCRVAETLVGVAVLT